MRPESFISPAPIAIDISSILSLSLPPLLLSSFSQMNPFTVFFLILSLVEETLASASTPGIQDCEPRNCGGVSISYPFWLGGQQPSYCGPPSFNLTCSDDNHTQTPVLKVLDQSYYIKNISYDDQSVQLTAAVFVNDPCPLPRFNLTADIYPFSPSPANKKIFFLYNCSSSMDPSAYQNISCAPHRTPAYFGGEYDGPGQLNSASSSCQLVVVPVLEHSEAGMKGNYANLLRTGWLLNWTATNCSECRESGGQCGYDESEARFACFCRDRIHLSSCKTRSSKKKFVIAGLAASTGFLALACALGFLFYRHKKRRQHFTSSKFLTGEVDTEIGAHFQTHLFSYDELMEATNCFNASRELGDGGFGIVYKGKLRDGRTVAVKRLYEKNYKRVEQFMNEVKILSHLRHQNLVSLYGCTSHSSHELLLVYEFVPNGTVADHLHGNRASERILTWPMRLNIAIEIADAIVYLHAVDPPVIHRDVKTNNILLDSNFHVKVADFGLSRPFPADATHVSTTPQGTPGYVDPEYHQCYQLTEKSDVYSFGVVLVELISSKPAFDISRQRSEIKLANMAIAKIQNHELDDLVDQELWCQSDEVTKTMITMVAELAFRCLQLDRDMRPSIREVHEGLRVIESTASRVDEQGKDDIWTQDGAGLVKNIVKFSPDSVAGKWVSHSTTPNNSE